MPTTYVQRSTASDLSVPGEYDLQLLEGAVAEVTRVIDLAISQTKEGYHYTEPGVPGADGVAGDYSVEVFIAVGDTNVLVSAAVARVNSSGTVQATSAFTAEQTAAGAVLTFNFSSPALGTWASGDRLRVAVRYRNSHTHTARSVTVSFNTTDSEVVAPWSAAAPPQSIAVTAAPETESAQAVAAVPGVRTVAVGAATESEVARPQGIGLSVLWATEFEVSTAWIDVGAASEVEAAQVVTPTEAAGEQTIPVGEATESEAAQPIGVASATTITVVAATETEAAQTVTPSQTGAPQTIGVTAASETETAQAVTVASVISVIVGGAVESETAQSVTPTPGAVSVVVGAAVELEEARAVSPSQAGAPQSRTVTAAIESEAAGVVAPDTIITVAVGAASETESAQTVTPIAVASITVTAAIETEAAQSVGIVTGPTSITVGFATETEQARIVGIQAGAGPQTIAVNTATETEGAEAVGIDTAISVLVGAAIEAEAAPAIAITTGPTSIPVGAAVETETAQPVLAVVGAQYDMIITKGGLKRGWETGRLGQRWRTGGPTKT